jgi:ubiquinone/menaquinone biosynthesis C-methylase UbiE
MDRTTSHVLAHYATGYEAQRLLAGAGQLERARTEDVLARYLPPPPARILDVGGGPGAYSTWLAARGYDVRLIDLVPLHVEQARRAFSQLGLTNASAAVCDARTLEVEPESQDVVLLMGPLYHLQDRDDRLRALREAWRILKPGGLIAASVISRYASLLDGMSRLLVRDPAFVEILEADLRSGTHENPTDRPDYFTTAFLHHPDEARVELGQADFADVELLALEGPFWCMASFEDAWHDDHLRALMLRYLRQIEREPSLLGASAHLMAIGKKPD